MKNKDYYKEKQTKTEILNYHLLLGGNMSKIIKITVSLKKIKWHEKMFCSESLRLSLPYVSENKTIL